MGLRLIMFAVTTIISILYVTKYAKRVKLQPESSIVYDIDLERTEQNSFDEVQELGKREKAILMVVVITVAILVFGVVKFNWSLMDIAGVFMVMGIFVAFVGKMGFDNYANALGRGMTEIAEGALIVGFARGILIVLENGHIIDTILHSAVGILQTLPPMASAQGMYIFQSLLSFIIPSGSGQAAVTIPIMAPLADMVGVTRQTMVLGFQMADGVQEILTPTSGWFMAGLAMANIPYTTWIKWAMKLLIAWYLIGVVFVAIAQTISYGPF